VAPTHLTGEVSGRTTAVVAAGIPALPFPQDWVGLHPPGLYPKVKLQFTMRVRRSGQGNSGEGRGTEIGS